MKDNVGSVNRFLKSALHDADDLIQKTTALEAVTKHPKEDVKEIKKDIEELRVDVKELRTDVKEFENSYTELHVRVVQLELHVVIGAPHASTLPSNNISSAATGHTIEVTPSDDTSAPLASPKPPIISYPRVSSEGSFIVADRLNIQTKAVST